MKYYGSECCMMEQSAERTPFVRAFLVDTADTAVSISLMGLNGGITARKDPVIGGKRAAIILE